MFSHTVNRLAKNICVQTILFYNCFQRLNSYCFYLQVSNPCESILGARARVRYLYRDRKRKMEECELSITVTSNGLSATAITIEDLLAHNNAMLYFKLISFTLQFSSLSHWTSVVSIQFNIWQHLQHSSQEIGALLAFIRDKILLFINEMLYMYYIWVDIRISISFLYRHSSKHLLIVHDGVEHNQSDFCKLHVEI